LRTILAAVDQSRHAHTVISRAAELACLLRNDMIILSVVGSDPMRQSSIGDERNQLAKFHRELIFKHFPSKGITVESNNGSGTVYRYAPAGIKIQSKILTGNPVDTICSYADEVGADLVIVGNRGLSNVGGLVLGSVSERVVHKCSRSVVVVRGEVIDSSDWEGILESQNSRQRI
jgi:nucleotide-binding universal stress UspA family protein